MPAVASRARSKGRRTMSQINMVPFIDVMLVLLIIFMVTATLIVPGQIELPSVGQAARQSERFVHVIIDAQGQLQVRAGTPNARAEPVALEQLSARVLALQAQAAGAAPEAGAAATGAALQALPVIISADRAVRYEAVVAAMDALQRAGVARVGLAVQQQP